MRTFRRMSRLLLVLGSRCEVMYRVVPGASLLSIYNFVILHNAELWQDITKRLNTVYHNSPLSTVRNSYAHHRRLYGRNSAPNYLRASARRPCPNFLSLPLVRKTCRVLRHFSLCLAVLKPMFLYAKESVVDSLFHIGASFNSSSLTPRGVLRSRELANRRYRLVWAPSG